MAEAPLSKNPYEVLGIGTGGPEVTGAEIKKAYRVKVLKLHPDKRPGTEREVAESEFNELQLYYELLCDPAARSAYDELAAVRRARTERNAALDDRRKRMREDLEAREKGFDASRNDMAMAKTKLKAELDRLRRAAAERERQAAADRKAAADSGSAASAARPSAEDTSVASEQLRRTLKLAWDRRDGDYSAASLMEIFGAFGKVEDLVLRESTKKAKGGALIVMATGEGARRAAGSQCGAISNPILVVSASKAGLPDPSDPPQPRTVPSSSDAGARASGVDARPSGSDGSRGSAAAGVEGGAGRAAFGIGGGLHGRAGAAAAAGGPAGTSAPFLGGFTAPLFAARGSGAGAFHAMASTGAVGRQYESATLHRMRQAAERAKLIAEMERNEREGEKGGQPGEG